MTKSYNAAQLKYLALACMLIDHLAALVLMPHWGIYLGIWKLDQALMMTGSMRAHAFLCLAMRYIGRLAFPIFCFFVVEAMQHTHSQERYLLRLAALAVVSEIPFDLAGFGRPFDTSYQSTILTLLLGAVTIYLLEKIARYYPKKAQGILSLSVVLVMMALSKFLHTDYDTFGILLITCLYALKGERHSQCTLGAMLSLSQATAALAFVPLYHYNGQRGHQWKYLFYIFYPIHLLILAML